MRLPKLLTAALGLVAVTTAAAPGWGPYVVHRGDTLWGLAQSHHTTVAALQAQNPQLSNGRIYAGETIQIPGLGVASTVSPATQQAATVTATTTYVVRAGDTLTSVAKAQHTTTAALASLNHLSGRLVIRIGQQLQLPGAPAAVSVPKQADPAYASSIATSATRLAGSSDPGTAAIQALVRAEAVRQHVDPRLAQAFAMQESGFHMRVVSSTGAIGVMQLMPVTAQWLGVDPYDLASNIRGGVTLIRTLVAQTGSTPNAIAAYYQGLSSLSQHGQYDDTKQYVANVTALMARFS